MSRRIASQRAGTHGRHGTRLSGLESEQGSDCYRFRAHFNCYKGYTTPYNQSRLHMRILQTGEQSEIGIRLLKVGTSHKGSVEW